MQNEQQKLIIDEQERNIILLASAGTGKTDTLARRIADIISRGKAESSEILCITFTNKACREMKERIEKIAGTEAKNMTIRTFHSFCYDVIKMEAKKSTDIFADFTIFDEDDCREIIKSCNYFDLPAVPMQRFIDTAKLTRAQKGFYSDDISQDYKKTVEYLEGKDNKKIDEICMEKGNINVKLRNFFKEKGHVLVNTYNSMLYNNHALDFTDLIVKTKEIMENTDTA
ncbi:MAG: UvrD-helicase domain-containing protein, partial [Clostridiaceae bacterium]